MADCYNERPIITKHSVQCITTNPFPTDSPVLCDFLASICFESFLSNTTLPLSSCSGCHIDCERVTYVTRTSSKLLDARDPAFKHLKWLKPFLTFWYDHNVNLFPSLPERRWNQYAHEFTGEYITLLGDLPMDVENLPSYPTSFELKDSTFAVVDIEVWNYALIIKSHWQTSVHIFHNFRLEASCQFVKSFAAGVSQWQNNWLSSTLMTEYSQRLIRPGSRER